MRALVVLLAMVCVLPAWAQTVEDSYVSERNSASAELKRMAQDPEFNPSKDLGKPELFTPAFRADYDRRRREVEQQLRNVVGPVPHLQGFARAGTLNPALCCYGRFGALDGLSFEGAGGNRVIVTTDGLLRRWLNESTDFWSTDNKPSGELPILFATPTFYLWSRASDWPVQKLVELPIGLVDNATAIGAFFALARPGPNWIALSVAKGGKVYVGFIQSRTRIAAIPACEATPSTINVDCWARQARDQPWFSDLLLEAAAFADSLPD